MMISRIALYHRWRRFQVTSIAYPLGLSAMTIASGVVVGWLSLH